MSEKKPRVVLLGWDAADWKIMTPLMDAGKMPNLQRFIEQGVMGNLSTIYPVLSPMLWTSIATGKRAWKHGIHGFTEPDPVSGGVRPVTNLGRKTKALWNMLNQEGYKSNVVGWWPSYPAEPINGVMVANQFQQASSLPGKPWPIKPGAVHPPEMTDAVAEFRIHPSEITAEEILPFVPLAEKVDQDKDKRLFNVAKTLAECASVHAISTALMELEEWDFTAIYHDAIDHFCHGFIRYHPPRLPWVAEEDFEIFQHVVDSAYQFHDMMLGRIMELAGPDAIIMICSDHGFHADHLRPRELPNEPAGPAEEHRHYGMFAAMGPGIRKDELVYGTSLLDITPTILQALGLPLGEDMDGKPQMAIFEEPVSPQYIDSWDARKGEDGCHPADLQIDTVDQHEALQQLVDLGYIDEVDDDKSLAANNAKKELRYNLARDLIGSGKHPDALEILADLWEEYPEESRFGIQQFDCYLTIARFARAGEILETLKERKAAYAQEATEKLKALQEQYKDKPFDELPDQEQRQINRLRKQSQTNAQTFAFLEGRLLLDSGNFEAALEKLNQARTVQVHNRPSLLQKIGEAHLGLKDWASAEQAFSGVLKIDPVNAMANYGLAKAYFAQDRLDEARARVQSSLGLFFHYPQAHYLCGVILEKQGFALDAVKALETAVAQNPVQPQAYRRLARIYRSYPIDPVKGREYLQLALAARARIRDFRAGKLEGPVKSLDIIDREELASLGDLGDFKVLAGLDDKEIIIVSGLPRSGTSMMMQMIEAGGIPVLTDLVREADESNIRGYYEYEPAKTRSNSATWLADAQGKAVKVVAQLLPVLDPAYHYRVVFMERPLDEVVRSQKDMLGRVGKQGAKLKARALADSYIDQIGRVRNVLSMHADKVSVLGVNYHDALDNAETTAQRVNQFLGGVLDEQAMVSAIEPDLRRQF